MKNVIKEELNFKERIIVRVFTKTFKSVYQLGVQEGFKWCNNHVR